MSLGTLAINNNSDQVAGTGTSFTTELKINDFIAVPSGGVTYTMVVKAIASNTSLTLTRPFSGPNVTGANWAAIPAGTMVGVTAKIADDTAYTMRMYVNEANNWMSLLTIDGEVTVYIPDGSSYTGPSWLKLSHTVDGLARKGANSDITSLSGLTTALSIEQGGTGGKSKAEARTNLGLGNSSTKDTGTSPGQVLLAGEAFGLGGNLAGYSYSQPTGFYTGQPDAPTPDYGGGCVRMSTGGYQSEWFSPLAGQVRFFARNINSISGGSAWAEFYSTHNTTKAADGTLKAASPIVKIFHDGSSETNDESEGCAVTRVSVGVYLVEGCTGLNSDAGWGGIDGGFDIPKDRNRQPLIWLDYEVNADGSVLVKTYHRTHPDAPAFARNEREGYTEGDPIDIPSDQFVSVRVEMPANSIWHQKQNEMREVMEKAERERQQNQQQEQL